MAELAVVRRYARALFETARRAETVDQVEQDLHGMDGVFRQVPRLRRALGAPTLSVEGKQQLLERTFASRISPLTLRFLKLAVERRRQDILTDVYPEFVRLANELRGVLPVEVIAATPLTDDERERLSGALARRTGKRIVLTVVLDPSLMGGLIVRMGDTVLDGSVRSKLAQLRSRLLAGRPA